MIKSFVYAMPAGVLPHLETILLALVAVCVLITLLCFFRFNRWILGVLFLVLATGLWVVAPKVDDTAFIRMSEIQDAEHLLDSGSESDQTIAVHDEAAPAAPAPQANGAAPTAGEKAQAAGEQPAAPVTDAPGENKQEPATQTPAP